MIHIAEQFEFPLLQGELDFFWSPAVCGLTGIFGAFAWWSILWIHSRDLSPVEPFSGRVQVHFLSHRIGVFDFDYELGCFPPD